MDDTNESYCRLGYFKTKKEFMFCFKNLPELDIFHFTFELDAYVETALWYKESEDMENLLILTCENLAQMKSFLGNQLILAIMVLSSKIVISRKMESIRIQIDKIFEVLGIRLKWLREGEKLSTYLQIVLVSNNDLRNLQQMYQQRKSLVNIQAIGNIKQQNAYHYVKELANKMLESVLSIDNDNITEKYDQMILELKKSYKELAALKRIPHKCKKWSFQKLEIEIHDDLVKSLERPVMTVESESDNNVVVTTIVSTTTTNPIEIQISDIFEQKFAEIDKKIEKRLINVEEFKGAINYFVKEVSEDLKSQENLVILMEFLLSKTFKYFQINNDHKDVTTHRSNRTVTEFKLDQKEMELANFEKKLSEAKKREKQRTDFLKLQIKKLQDQLYKLNNREMNLNLRLESIMLEKDEKILALQNRIIDVESELRELNHKHGDKITTITESFETQLEEERIKVQKLIKQLEEQKNKSKKKKQGIGSISTSIKLETLTSVSSPVANSVFDTKDLLSLKSLVSQEDEKMKTVTPKALETKSKVFFKKGTLQNGFKSPKNNDNFKKASKKEEMNVKNNLDTLITYVKEQSKNFSQKGMILKGNKENYKK